MKTGYEVVLREFLSNSSDEEIRYLGTRLSERLQDDLSDVLEHVGKSSTRNVAIDTMFRSATSADELYDYCDALKEMCIKEAERRKVSLARGKF